MSDSVESETIFSKIVKGEIPAHIVYESDSVVGFKDVNPQAPAHFLVVPRRPISNLTDVGIADKALLGELLLAASEIAKAQGLDETGYRIVINNGEAAGQTVFHLHLHILGGRIFSWPPG